MLRARPLLSHGCVCKGTLRQCLEPNPYWATAVTEPWLAMACKSHWLEWVGEGHTLPGKDANTSRAHSFSGLARLLTHCWVNWDSRRMWAASQPSSFSQNITNDILSKWQKGGHPMWFPTTEQEAGRFQTKLSQLVIACPLQLVIACPLFSFFMHNIHSGCPIGCTDAASVTGILV